MNKIKRFQLYLFALTALFIGCNRLSHRTKVVLYTRAPINAKLYIKNVPFFSEKEGVVDSAIIKDNHDSLVLYVPRNEERLFKIVVLGRRLTMDFINDSEIIRIHADYFSNKYTINGSKATLNLKNFEDSQIAIADKLKKISKSMDSLTRRQVQHDSLTAQFNNTLALFFKRYVAFDDTVTSPAAFVKVYNSIEFDDDYKGLKKFILHNAARFPNYKPIQQLKSEALATVKIYEKEFNVGDLLPSITLPDVNGTLFSTSSLKGSYYLIDFWSTWCPQCMPFKVVQKEMFTAKNSRVKLVSIAIDNQEKIWKNLIHKNNLNWVQLIDEKMWQGTAVNTLYFDSIPFNFLVSPQGRIIKKAIKPDSLLKIISELK